MSTSQRDAVFEATVNALKEAGVGFKPGSTDVKNVATSDIRKLIVQNLCQQFLDGKISLKDTPTNKEKLSDADKLRDYVSSLVSNHWKRDTKLNGTSSI